MTTQLLTAFLTLILFTTLSSAAQLKDDDELQYLSKMINKLYKAEQTHPSREVRSFANSFYVESVNYYYDLKYKRVLEKSEKTLVDRLINIYRVIRAEFKEMPYGQQLVFVILGILLGLVILTYVLAATLDIVKYFSGFTPQKTKEVTLKWVKVQPKKMSLGSDGVKVLPTGKPAYSV